MKAKKLLFVSLFINTLYMLPLQAQDWANLAYFSEANAALSASGKTGPRVIFMGNSITKGWPEFVPAFWDNPAYINRGISGQTTPQMLVRFRADVLAHRPDVVVLLAGTNDIAGNTGPMTLEETFGHIQSMAALARLQGAEVVLSAVLPVYDYAWKPGLAPAQKIVRLNGMLRSLAEKEGYGYIDYHSAMADERMGLKPELTYDGVHPNEAGYRVMGPLAEAEIVKALAKK